MSISLMRSENFYLFQALIKFFQKGNTALIFACKENHPITVSLLLANGADFTLTNDEENTAYIEAIARRNYDAQLILENHMKQLLT